jgi:hypothetical protein
MGESPGDLRRLVPPIDRPSLLALNAQKLGNQVNLDRLYGKGGLL